MLEAILNKRRYELQQQLLFNPNGLATGTTNRFGSVDGGSKVSSMKSISHSSYGSNILNVNLSNQPTFTIDYWGVGVNSILFDNTSVTNLNANNTFFSPEWNQEFYTAIKLNYTSRNTVGFRQVFQFFGEIVSNNGAVKCAIMARDLTDKVDFALSAYDSSTTSWKKKEIRTTAALTLGSDYTIIIHHKGTDDINDNKIYVNGVDAAFTVVSNNSFVGATFYPGLATNQIKIGLDERTDTGYSGHLGKSIFGLGAPEVDVLHNSLNSAT